ncbi:MAG: hypothetical protein Fur0042_05330 [Cyanophyceae cyanobacterium]
MTKYSYQPTALLRLVTNPFTKLSVWLKVVGTAIDKKPGVLKAMGISDTQIYVALLLALVPAVLAYRLSTALYK